VVELDRLQTHRHVKTNWCRVTRRATLLHRLFPDRKTELKYDLRQRRREFTLTKNWTLVRL